jgi:phosphohistidine phosphatase
MALYLIQHGKALPKEADPEQRLSPEGRAEAERIAALARGQGVTVRRI